MGTAHAASTIVAKTVRINRNHRVSSWRTWWSTRSWCALLSWWRSLLAFRCLGILTLSRLSRLLGLHYLWLTLLRIRSRTTLLRPWIWIRIWCSYKIYLLSLLGLLSRLLHVLSLWIRRWNGLYSLRGCLTLLSSLTRLTTYGSWNLRVVLIVRRRGTTLLAVLLVLLIVISDKGLLDVCGCGEDMLKLPIKLIPEE